MQEQFAYVYKDGNNGHMQPVLGMGRSGSYDAADSTDEYFTFTVSVMQEDRDGDIVVPMGCDLTNFNRNPVWHFGHQELMIPIGTSRDKSGQVWVMKEENRLRARWYPDYPDPDAAFIAGKVKRGVLNATSIAFVPLEARRRDDVQKAHQHEGENSGWIFSRIDLTEVSIVSVPSNAGAVRDMLDNEKSFITPKLRKGLSVYAAKSTNEAGGCWTGWCPTCPPKVEKKMATTKHACGCSAGACGCKKAVAKSVVKAIDKVVQVEGHEAAMSGKSRASNPYRNDLDKSREWEHGYDMGLKDRQAALRGEKSQRRKAVIDYRQFNGRWFAYDGGNKVGGPYATIDDAKTAHASKRQPVMLLGEQDDVTKRRGKAVQGKFITVNGVRYKASTSSDVRSPTSTETSTEAYTAGNFTATVTGGAGEGDTVVNIYPTAPDEEDEDKEKVGTSKVGLMKMGKHIVINGKRYKALGESSGAAGGYTVATEEDATEKAGTSDTEYDQGYVAAWDGRGASTNPYKNDADPGGREMSEDWAAGWRDGARERLAGRKSVRRKKYDECSKCKGTGLINGKFCDACKGQGTIYIETLVPVGTGKSHRRCTFCKGTGSGCGRRGDCPDCGGRGVVRTKQARRAMKHRRKDLTTDDSTAETKADAPPHEQAMAHLYNHAKSEMDYVTQALEGITPFDPSTGEANAAHGALKEYGDSVGQRMESLKSMFSDHTEGKDIDEAVKGLGTDDTGEANLVGNGQVPPGDDVVVEADLDDQQLMGLDDAGAVEMDDDAAVEMDVDSFEMDEDQPVEKRMTDCPQCGGSGEGDNESPHGGMEDCEMCGGSGTVNDAEKAIDDDSDVTKATDEPDEFADDHDTSEILERYQNGAKRWASRKCSRQRVRKVLRAGGRVKEGQDGRKWLVVPVVRKALKVGDKVWNVNRGTGYSTNDASARGTVVSADENMVSIKLDNGTKEAYSVAQANSTFKLKSLHRKSFDDNGDPAEQKSLPPEHAEAVKSCGSMLKGLSVAHDMPEHHKSALDMHGDAVSAGDPDSVGKALKHMKSLADAPDVPTHHKEALNHHAKAMAKALKAMGADEDKPAEEEKGDDEAVEETKAVDDDGNPVKVVEEQDPTTKALWANLQKDLDDLNKTKRRVGII